eukprot:gnl/TRDRNA2_/TRDRNA2_186618_c0_seq1.p1 gnl/TRDRNA2_/TRDRNA2_186618_c0~~gnl/TRDRNA2_/TRDRNA2_186618_c0_seq1.p1  ORF type:complete len:413 (-),score=33.40 gnl/TRDRNA2_/TRDRNA2_186618_c0_seq1:59-1297(-)
MLKKASRVSQKFNVLLLCLRGSLGIRLWSEQTVDVAANSLPVVANLDDVSSTTAVNIQAKQSPHPGAKLPTPGKCCEDPVPDVKRNESGPVDFAHRLAHLIFRVIHRDAFYDENGCGKKMPAVARSAMIEALATLDKDLCGSMDVPVDTVRRIHRHFRNRNGTVNETCVPCSSASAAGLDALNLAYVDIGRASKLSQCPDFDTKLKNIHGCLVRRLSAREQVTAPKTLGKGKQYAGQGCQLDTSLAAQYGNWCGVNARNLAPGVIEGPETSFHGCEAVVAKPSARYTPEYTVCRDGGTDEACLRHDHSACSEYWHHLDLYVTSCRVNQDLLDSRPQSTNFLDHLGNSEYHIDEGMSVFFNLVPCSYWDPVNKRNAETHLWWWPGEHGNDSCARCSSAQGCYLVPPGSRTSPK